MRALVAYFIPPLIILSGIGTMATDQPILRALGVALSVYALIVVMWTVRPPASNRGASSVRCEFGSGQSLGPIVNSPVFDGGPTVSADETELFFTSERKKRQDLFVSTRPNREAPWSDPVNLGAPIDDSTAGDFSLRLSGDGKALYFASSRSGGFGKADLYVATRASRQHPWGPATNLGPRVNTEAFEAFATPSADGMTLYFNRSTTFDSQDSDIWVTSRAGPDDEWSVPHRVPGGINSDRAEFSPSLSTDGNTMFFASARAGGVAVWIARRVNQTQEWGTPERLGAQINVAGSMTLAPFISSDQRSLYFMSARPDTAVGGACTPKTCFDRVDLYRASVTCR